MIKEDVYKMKLHDRIADDSGMLAIIRVPGGWIYESWSTNSIVTPDHIMYNDERPVATTFVPFDNEFQVVGDMKF